MNLIKSLLIYLIISFVLYSELTRPSPIYGPLMNVLGSGAGFALAGYYLSRWFDHG